MQGLSNRGENTEKKVIEIKIIQKRKIYHNCRSLLSNDVYDQKKVLLQYNALCFSGLFEAMKHLFSSTNITTHRHHIRSIIITNYDHANLYQ